MESKKKNADKSQDLRRIKRISSHISLNNGPQADNETLTHSASSKKKKKINKNLYLFKLKSIIEICVLNIIWNDYEVTSVLNHSESTDVI